MNESEEEEKTKSPDEHQIEPEPDRDPARDPPTPSSEETPAGADATPDREPDSTDRRPTVESLPYKLRRQKVNEDRDQVPFFLRDEIVEAEDDLQNALEEMLGENVYKSDYREAAMVVAQRHPDLVAEVLREWGYDLDAR